MISRRLVLALLMGAGAASAEAKAKGRKVIVIGAGLSGLAAAQALKAQGAEVIVLEARGRIGGRIWTSRLWPDMPMDLGASWIHGTKGNPLTALADAANANRLSTRYDAAITLGQNGTEIEADDWLDEAETLVAKARATAEKSSSDVSLAKAIQTSPRWHNASGELKRQVRFFVNSAIEQEYAGSWNEASALFIDDSKEFGGGDVLFPEGFDQITRHLANGLDVRLKNAVNEISPRGRGVVIRMGDGGSLEADHAIVTVPLGVLRAGSIRFSSPLAEARQKAIDSLRMGLLNKCWLRFEKMAWPRDVDWIEWQGPKDGYWAEWVSLARVASTPVLLGFHAGDQARELEKYDDRATMASAHDALRAMFGSGFPAPAAAQITRWSQDPLALGSYSFNAVGVTSETRKALAGLDWQGRLAFAGEATSPHHFGTAHGAVLSGRAAAKTLSNSGEGDTL